MTAPTTDQPDQPDQPSQPASKQVDDLLSSSELAHAVENEETRLLLDHIPIAIVVSRLDGKKQCIFYVNPAFEKLTGQSQSDVAGHGWGVLDTFRRDNNADQTLGQAVLAGEDFLGTFRRNSSGGDAIVAQAYASQIDKDDGTENFRIVALVDAGSGDRLPAGEFGQDVHGKDTLLKELQHRVKNNLQLITALIRLESRNAQRGDSVDLSRLAGRIDALASLYQALSADALGVTVDLGPYLSTIASAVVQAHAFSNIQLELKVGSAALSVNVAMPVGLLVNELLTNAFKHGFVGRDKGVIVLESSQDGDQYRVVVADDGVGFSGGATWPARGKIGALVLQTLNENTAHSAFEIETAPGAGTRTTITFTPKPVVAPVARKPLPVA